MSRSLLALLLLSGFSAFGANPKAAALVSQAEKLYETHAYADAAELMLKAYELDPVSRYLYDAARAFDRAGKLRKAEETYTQYLDLGEDKRESLLTQRAAAALQRIENVSDAPATANASESKRASSASSASTASASSSTTSKRESRSGTAPTERSERAERPVRSTSSTAAPSSSSPKMGPIIMLGLSVVSLGVGIGVGVMANGTRSAFSQATVLSTRKSLATDVQVQAAVADVFFGVSLVSAVTGVILIATAKDPAPVAVVPVRGGAVLSFGGAF